MHKQVVDPVFERFLVPSDRAQATHELAARGALAVPLLQALFSGQATNQNGVAYPQLGMPLDCGLVAASHLGQLARPLEPYLREELIKGHPYAAQALGSLGTLENESILGLAAALQGNVLLAFEAANALARCHALAHPAVRVLCVRASGLAVKYADH
jgi:hypothetical protein